MRPRIAACLALLFAACGQEPRDGPHNVLLICMDTVRADHLGCYGYAKHATTPALDELAARSTVFLDTTSTAGWTKPSVPSLLTGTYPLQHGVYQGSSRDEAGAHSDVLPRSARTLAEVFAEARYQTAAFVKNAQLRRGLGFEQGFDLYLDEAGDAREIRWHASDWLDARDPERPFFLYLHFLDAHWPYRIPEEYAGRFVEAGRATVFQGRDWREVRDEVNDGRRELGAEELEALLALYDGAIRYIDDQLALLFAKLEREGVLEDTIVCVVADHGEEFLEHGRIGHGHGLYENLLRIPWILHVPGDEARRALAPCSLVDLFPTLLGAAGLGPPGGLPGVDRRVRPGARVPLFAEHLEPGSYRQSLREDATKLVRQVRPRACGASAPPALRPSGRWEARVQRGPGGELRALRLRPGTEAASEPTELKGPIDAVTDGGIELLGVSVRLGANIELYGDVRTAAGEERRLEPGMLAKAVGALDAEQRVFVAAKLKLYGAGDEVELDVRGELTEIDGARARIGGVWVAFDEHTELSGAAAGERRMGRADVLDFLAPEGGDFEVSLERLDLGADPGEARPGAVLRDALVEVLDRIGRAFLGGRLWDSADTAALSEKDLADLRAIGYGE